MTHTSYELSKKLKEFLGDYWMRPIENKHYTTKNGYRIPLYMGTLGKKYLIDCFPAYTLEDLLSKPFCLAMWKKLKEPANWTQEALARAYYTGGFPVVEAELLKLMEGK